MNMDAESAQTSMTRVSHDAPGEGDEGPSPVEEKKGLSAPESPFLVEEMGLLRETALIAVVACASSSTHVIALN